MIIGYRVRVTLLDGTYLWETRTPGIYSLFRAEARLFSSRPTATSSYETVVRVTKR